MVEGFTLQKTSGVREYGANNLCEVCGINDFELIHQFPSTWDSYKWWTDEEDGGITICAFCKEKRER